MQIAKEPLHLISSSSRAKMNNPNVANQDFNPILHSHGYHNNHGNTETTSKQYGSIPNKPMNGTAAGLIVPNTTAGSNKIF
jgi:hypothetical protein